MRCAWLLMLAAIAPGCSFDTNGVAPGDDGGTVADGAEVDGAPADAPGPDAQACTGTARMCVDDTHFSGCIDGFVHNETCAFGCLSTPEAHCAQPVVSNGLDLAWLDGADRDVAVAQGDTLVFDTTTGTVSFCGGAVLHSAAAGLQNGLNFQIRPAPSVTDATIGVWAFRSLRVDGAATVRVIGDKPAAFLVSRDAHVEGIIDASGGVAACDPMSACGQPSPASKGRSCGGPGGGFGGAVNTDGDGAGHGHAGQSAGPMEPETGGGGAAFSALGGQGGGSGGGAPGDTYGAAECEPLASGSGGGGGGEANVAGGVGGGGGGALQLTALGRIEVLAPVGSIRIGGAGGGAGVGSSKNGGGGGGSGGAVLLESGRVKITGVVAANGGGGGGAGSDAAQPGNGGLASASAAAGGGGPQPGGNGGALVSGTGASGNPTNHLLIVDGTGGGGGGVGRIFLRALEGAIELTNATVSPAPGQGALRLQ